MTTTPEFRTWAVIQLFGHVTLAGEVSEQTIADFAFVRLDVPATSGGQEAFTKFYGPSAIYDITPTTEDVARAAVENLRPRPVSVYLLPSPRSNAVSQGDPDPSEQMYDEEDGDDD